MKKIIIAISSLVLFFGTSSVLASYVTWNTAGNDCNTVSIANHETREGFGDPCWPGTTISAQPGQSVNVRIYYHNTGTLTATNTRVILNAPTINSESSTHSFSGQIVSDQGSSSSFTVRVNLSSPQKLIFSSTNWFTENTNETRTNLLYGQTGQEVLGGGLGIGSIAPGWATQGSVVVAFRVSDPKPTGTITAATNSCYINAGSSSCNINFTWSTQNPIGTSKVVDKNNMTVATSNSGNQAFSIPFGSSTFTLINNNANLDSESVSASCKPDMGASWNGSICALPLHDCEITSFVANPISSSPGDLVTLSWTTNYCNSVDLINNFTNLSPNSSKSVWPNTTTTYYLKGNGDTAFQPTKTVTVTVGGPAGAPTFPAGAPTFGY